MRVSWLVALYLVVYYLTVSAAIVTLRRIGALERAPLSWSAGGIAVAVAVGLLLAATSIRRPRAKRRRARKDAHADDGGSPA